MILVFLIQSRAFDTVDHDIRFFSTENHFSLSSGMPQWFTSYLKERNQRESIQSVLSDILSLLAGMPSDSVRCSALFTMYAKQLDTISWRHEVKNHSCRYLYCGNKANVTFPLRNLEDWFLNDICFTSFNINGFIVQQHDSTLTIIQCFHYYCRCLRRHILLHVLPEYYNDSTVRVASPCLNCDILSYP